MLMKQLSLRANWRAHPNFLRSRAYYNTDTHPAYGPVKFLDFDSLPLEPPTIGREQGMWDGLLAKSVAKLLGAWKRIHLLSGRKYAQ